MNLDQLRKDFFGRDPVAGDRALNAALSEHKREALKLLLPLDESYGTPEPQVQIRLKKLTAALAPESRDHLIAVIRNGQWDAGNLAAPAFAGLRGDADAAMALTAILKRGDIDPQRHAIEALGYLERNEMAYDITDFARYGALHSDGRRSVSSDLLSKFSFYTFLALVRMTRGLGSIEEIRRCLSKFKELLATVRETKSTLPSTWDMLRVRHSFGPISADPIIAEWIESDDELLQEFGVDALGKMRLNRTARFLLDVMLDATRAANVRSSAGISLSQFAHPVAAAELAGRLRKAEGSPGFDWAFAGLYAQRAAWPDCTDIVARLADMLETNNPPEPAVHMAYSLACLRAPGAERIFDVLASPDSHVRGMIALGCARCDPVKALEVLRSREREAASPTEQALYLAAMIHAGDPTKVDALHMALQSVVSFHVLRPTWKREVLHAFFVAEGPDSERGRLWCEASFEDQGRLAAEIVSVLPQGAPARALPSRGSAAVMQPAPAQPAAATAQEEALYDVFISHASEDKEDIARPLFVALRNAGIRVWFDEATLKLGDSLSRKIDEGLARCRYGIVILSPSFLSKEWPKTELSGLVARETASGKKAILPIWHQIGHAELVKKSPLLADRLAVSSSKGLDAVVREIRDALAE